MMELHGKLSTIHPEENLNVCTRFHDKPPYVYISFEMIDTKPRLRLMVAPEEIRGTLKSEVEICQS